METDADAEIGVVTDLSTTGLYFRSLATFEVGARIRAALWTGQSEVIGAALLVVRRESLHAGLFGYGAEIVGMTEDHRRQLGERLTELRRKELARDWARV